MLAEVATVLLLACSAFFAVAGVLKLAAVSAFRAQLTEYALLPPRAVAVAAVALPVVELGAASLAVPRATRPIGAAVMACLLVVFALAMALSLRRGNDAISCACLGRRSQRLHRGLVLRNAVLAAAAATAVALDGSPLPPVGAWVAGALVAALWLAPIEYLRVADTVSASRSSAT